MAHSRLSYGLSSQYICYNNEEVRYAGRASATGRPNAAAGMLSDSGTAAAIGSAGASAGKGGLGEVSANGCSGTRGTQARELELVLLAAVGGSLAAFEQRRFRGLVSVGSSRPRSSSCLNCANATQHAHSAIELDRGAGVGGHST